MKRPRLLLLAACLAGGPCLVLAQAAAPQPPASAPTRDQVRQETREAVKAGKIEHGEADHAEGRPAAKPPKSTTSRESVRKEAAAANKAGTIEHGEVDHAAGKPPPKPAKSTVSRETVKKEAAAAAKAGQTESGEASVQQKAEEGVKPRK